MPADTHRYEHLQAILLDFDGTIVDTEPIWMQVELDMMVERGADWTLDESRARNGHSLPSTAEVMLERLGDDSITVDAWIAEMSERVVTRVREEQPELRPGIAELLAQAHAEAMPCAIVTSSPKAMTDALAGRWPGDQFGSIVTYERPRHLKPHPEPYLMAAAELGVDIRHCVVVEDSIPGATAGEAAGAMVLGCPTDNEMPATRRRVVVDSVEGLDLAWLDQLVADNLDEVGSLSGVRRGPLLPGERVTLTDQKGRRHSLVLVPGKSFHTTKGGLAHDSIIGQPEGIVATTVGGLHFLVMRPLLSEYTTTMPREAAVIYPKDAAQILMWADIFPGARVLEPGFEFEGDPDAPALPTSMTDQWVGLPERCSGEFTSQNPVAQDFCRQTEPVENPTKVVAVVGNSTSLAALAAAEADNPAERSRVGETLVRLLPDLCEAAGLSWRTVYDGRPSSPRFA